MTATSQIECEIEDYPTIQGWRAPIVAPSTEQFGEADLKPLVHSSSQRVVRVQGYQIHEEIGRGGMGVVYRAKQMALGRSVALKVILGGGFASDVDRSRFHQEAEAVARLQHPNVVAVHDLGEADGQAYIAFELIEGGTLRNWQRGRPIEPKLAATIAAQIARAVQHAHENGILHRDLKPANILVTSSDDIAPRIKVTDFGLAKVIDSPLHLTDTGLLCGTPNYMAPEQIGNDKTKFTALIDVYGVGSILYELLTGVAPYDGMSSIEILTRILTTPPTAMRQLNAKLPRDIVVIVEKCLDRDPARRYRSAAKLAEDLDRFAHGQPVKARPLSAVEKAWRWCRQNPSIAALISVLTVGFVALFVASMLVWQSAESERSSRLEATRSRDVARAAHKDAEAIGKDAEANFDLARKAFTTSILELCADRQFANDEDIKLRQKMLENSKPFFDIFLKKLPNDPVMLKDLGNTLSAIAFLEGALGKHDSALKYGKQAEDIFRGLMERTPHDHDAQAQLAINLTANSNLAAKISQWKLATEKQHEAKSIYLGLIEREPEKGDHVMNLTRLTHAVHLRLMYQRKIDEATKATIEELELASHLICRFGEKPEYLQVYSVSLHSYSLGLMRSGRTDEAEKIMLESVAARERLVELTSGAQQQRHRSELAMSLDNLGLLYLKSKRNTQAEPLFQRSMYLNEMLVRDLPRIPDHQVDLARNQMHIGQLEQDAGRIVTALVWFGKACDTVKKPMAGESQSASMKRTAFEVFRTRAELLEQQGRNKEALADWQWIDHYNDKDPPSHRKHFKVRLASQLYRNGQKTQAELLVKAVESNPQRDRETLFELSRYYSLLALDDPKQAAKAREWMRRANREGIFNDPNYRNRYDNLPEFATIRNSKL